MKQWKLFVIAAAFVLTFSACAERGSAEQTAAENTPKPEAEEGEPINIPGTESTFSTDFSRYSVEADEILSGGPPKDGIPSLTDPDFVSLESASAWIGAMEPVILVVKGERKKAYPLQILMFHEIVNDTIGEIPIAVTYCPLCNTSVVYHAEIDGMRFEFGTTGRLRFSNLLMYDRQTESWWQQASGKGVIGRYTGTELEIYPSIILSFRDLRTLHPDAVVQSKQTGHGRPYGVNPYEGYDTGSPWAYRNGPEIAGGVDPMERAVVAKVGGEERIFRYPEVEEKRVIVEVLGGKTIAAFWDPAPVSALDDREIRSGRTVGGVNIFYAETNGKKLSLFLDSGSVKDEETGTEWNSAGLGVAGPLAGGRLLPAPAVQHFWFSAYVFSASR